MIQEHIKYLQEKFGDELNNYTLEDVRAAAEMLAEIDTLQADLSAEGFEYSKKEVFEIFVLPENRQDNFIGLVAAGISAIGMVAKALIDRKTTRESNEAAADIAGSQTQTAEYNAQAAEYEAMMQERQEAIAAQQAELARIKMLEQAELEKAEKEAEKEQREKLIYAGAGVLVLAIILLLIFK